MNPTPEGAVAVVTGAGRGIGREIAWLLAERGHRVVVTDLDEEAARDTAKTIGRKAVARALDVRDPVQHHAVASCAVSLGPLAVWVNNAGMLVTGKAWEHGDDEVRALVEANVLGVMYGSRSAVRAMRDQRYPGDVINIASLSALGPVPGLAVYAATKAAVLSFSTSLQGDLRLAGAPIRVHAVCPDGTDTPMLAAHTGDEDSALIFTAPRVLDAREVAAAAVRVLGRDRLVRSV
ncbi:MAG: SDR family oxidoreductase, partial [Streptomycetales bacterium]